MPHAPRPRLARLLPLALLVPLVACSDAADGEDDPDPGNSARAYCERDCACAEAEQQDDCVDTCTDGLARNLGDAVDLGCDNPYRDYLSCLGREYACGVDVEDVCRGELARANDACSA